MQTHLPGPAAEDAGPDSRRGPLRPRVLSIAGSDSGGGAGIQADLKTIAAFGGYGMTALTAVTAQNTQGVQAVEVLSPALVRAQLESVGGDIVLDAVKIGMLGSVAVMDEVADWLERLGPPRVVLDPVMVATSGDCLTDSAGVAAAQAWARLMDAADLVTPNLPELAVLVGEPGAGEAWTWEAAQERAARLAARHDVAVLLKGGHLGGGADGRPHRASPDASAVEVEPDLVPDAIVTAHGVETVTGPRLRTRSTHGTGCTLSSAMAVLGASGHGWAAALHRAKPWLLEAMGAGAGLQVGDGSRPSWHGPVDHGVPPARDRAHLE